MYVIVCIYCVQVVGCVNVVCIYYFFLVLYMYVCLLYIPVFCMCWWWGAQFCIYKHIFYLVIFLLTYLYPTFSLSDHERISS